MSQDQRLREQLSELGKHTTDAGQRTISGSDVGMLTTRILREVDETILPRKVIFENEIGQIFQIEAAARRILKVKFTATPTANANHDSVSGQIFSDPTGPLVAKLRHALSDFLSKTQSLTVATQKTDTQNDPSQIGCSAVSIAQVWGYDLFTSPANDAGDVLAQLIDACGESVVAWMLFDAETITAKSGDPAFLSRIAAVDPQQMVDFDAKLIRVPGEKSDFACVVFSEQTPNGTALLFARDAEKRAFICIPSAQVPAIQEVWETLFRR
jgi:hypothetical protein